MNDIVKIALGVFIGALAAAFTWEAIQAVRLEMAIKQANAEMKKVVNADNERRAKQAQAEAEEQRQREQLAEDAAKQQEQARREKEAAFARFFQPSAACKADPIQADCANAYIKAQTIFNSQYTPKQ